jgi:hypothetical protein
MLALAASLVACNKDADNDEDGFPASEDCNDEDASINPDADEVCDLVDNNCDAITDVDATDAVEFYGDADGDGFGGEALTLMACEAPEGFFATNDDCDDTNADVNPDGLEICDGLDNDCDGALDDADDSVDLSTITDWYPDFDGDGYGDDSAPVQSCSAPAGHVIDGGDCDDIDPLLNPETVWYADVDGDGYGSNDFTTIQCEQPNNHTFVSADCDDSNPNINPDALEVCDAGADNDCDGLIDDDDDSLDLDTRSLWYPDADADGYGDDQDAGALYCNGPSGTANNAEDCDDVDATLSPAEVEVCDDGLDNDCSGDAPECGLTGDNSITSANYSMTGKSTYDYLGRRVAVADVNGDGTDDVFAAAYSNDDNGSSSGTVYGAYGPLSGASTYASADWTGAGDSSSDYYGFDVEKAGDLNADGYDDIIVGSYGEDDNGSSSGTAYIYLGSASGLSSDAAVELYGANSSDYLGYTTAGLGDVSGDGGDDFAVGAYGNDDSASSAGAVYIWFGVPTASQSADNADVAIFGEASYDYMGYVGSVTAGDYDGDGTNDVMTAAYSADNNGSGSGTAYVNYGPLTSGTSLDAGDSDVLINGSTSSDYLGYGSASGDLNDDGYDDLALGAYGNDTGGSSAGQAYVFYGSASGWSGSVAVTSADVTVTGGASSDYMGRAITMADFNGDSNTDLMVGAGGNDDNGSTAGKLYVFSGPLTSGSSLVPADSATQIGGASGGYCGYYDVGAGDFDGDGNTDYLAPCYYGASNVGAIYVFSGGGM